MKALKVLLLMSVVMLISVPAAAQRGVGDPFGVARMKQKPEVVTLSGTLIEVKTGPCEATTGRSFLGTHLMVQTEDGIIDLHLGPASATKELVGDLDPGILLSIKAFRTDQHADDAYVAQSLQFEDHPAIYLRDDSLRPMWQMSRGRRGR